MLFVAFDVKGKKIDPPESTFVNQRTQSAPANLELVRTGLRIVLSSFPHLLGIRFDATHGSVQD
jgi:hypothetical protein